MADKTQKMKDYETAVRHRVECEERAFHIVNKLLEGKVQAPYLIECGKLISREHYSDIIEERAISFLCGYPLCDNSLADIPKKKYHISTKTNRVYDITERKNFCSNQCLKASKHFSNQIPESPVWTRAREPPPDIKLLEHHSVKGIIGDEVVGVSPKRVLEEEVKTLDELDKVTLSSSKNSRNPDHLSSKSTTGSWSVKKKIADQKETMKSAMAGNGNAEELSSNLTWSECAAEAAQRDPSSVEDGEPPVEPTLEKAVKKLTISGDQDEYEKSTEAEADKTSEKLRDTENFDKGMAAVVKKSAAKESMTNDTETGNQEKKSVTKVSHKSDKIIYKDSARKSAIPNSSEDQAKKLDHLMNLLSSRKSLLSKMVDIQPVVSGHMVNTVSSDKVELPPKSDIETPVTTNTEQITGSLTSIKNSSSSEVGAPKQTSVITLPVEKAKARKKKTEPTSKSPLERIKTVLKGWVTDETIGYLQSSSQNDSEGPQKFSDPRIQKDYMDLCKRLDVQEKELENILGEPGENASDAVDKDGKLKSAPDYEALKKEAEVFQLKVTEFITGKKPVSKASKKNDDDEEKDPIVLPTVDAYDQRQIRIKIVLERLDKAIPDLLTPLCLSLQDVSSILRELAYTFRLERDSIVFKPSEWTLVAIFILKMLAQKNRNIAEAFSRDSAIRYFSIVLKGIGHAVADLDIMTEDIVKSCSQDAL